MSCSRGGHDADASRLLASWYALHHHPEHTAEGGSSTLCVNTRLAKISQNWIIINLCAKQPNLGTFIIVRTQVWIVDECFVV